MILHLKKYELLSKLLDVLDRLFVVRILFLIVEVLHEFRHHSLDNCLFSYQYQLMIQCIRENYQLFQ